MSVLASLLAAITPATTIVIASSLDPDVAEHAARVAKQQKSQGHVVLELELFSERFLGTETTATKTTELSAWDHKLTQARTLEANFETEAANALRLEVIGAFDRTARPQELARVLASTAYLDYAAALLGEQRVEQAEHVALEARRRFANAHPHPDRYPPAVVRLFDQALDRLATLPQVRLEVRTDVPGDVYVDGTLLGRVRDRLERTLPAGRYRVWLEHADGMSWPHPVDLEREGAVLNLLARRDARLHLAPHLALVCDRPCPDWMASVGQRVGAARVVVVGQPSATPVILKPDTMPQVAPIAATTIRTSSGIDAFSAWYLVPFGGGQFAQERWVTGSVVLALQLGLGVWHAVSVSTLEREKNRADFERLDALTARQNVSAALFYGSLGAGVAEALLYGVFVGDSAPRSGK